MKLSELKEWFNNMPEELSDSLIVNREMTEDLEEGSIKYKDTPIVFITVDKDRKLIILHDVNSNKIVQKIRDAQSEKPEEKTEE